MDVLGDDEFCDRYNIDNMEGLAVRDDPRTGRIFVYVISDNNYNEVGSGVTDLLRSSQGSGRAKDIIVNVRMDSYCRYPFLGRPLTGPLPCLVLSLAHSRLLDLVNPPLSCECL